ncbi:MAG: ParB N-terminal domain-containing protein [Candidatus Methanomethylicus sp.]|nr:ParB N-terminal domain-containing protein [Candidatus Methanomethylicus sp.]
MPKSCYPPKISVISLDIIKPHEEYDDRILDEIQDSFSLGGVVRDPILVDSSSYMILDGTHRYWALKKLGCQSIPVALYSYMSDSVKIGCWYRCLEICDLKIYRKGNHSKLESSENALAAVKNRQANVSVICKDSARVYTSNGFDIQKAYSMLSDLEKDYKNRGHRVTFATESDSVAMLRSGLTGAILAPPPIWKEEAIHAAQSGELFPIKSTRHILPSRPMGINVPIAWLRLAPAEANENLKQKLAKASFSMIPRGSMIRGRRYEEEVYIYEHPNP